MLVNIVCKGKLQQVSLENCGVIELADDCLIRHDKMQINSHGNFPASIKGPILPTINPKVFENVTNIDFQKFHVLYKEHNKSLKNIEVQIHQIKEQQKLPNENLQSDGNWYDIHHFVLGYVLAGVILVIIIYLWFCQRVAGAPTPSSF